MQFNYQGTHSQTKGVGDMKVDRCTQTQGVWWKMVQRRTTGHNRRHCGTETNRKGIPRPTNGWTPRNSADERPDHMILLVAKTTEGHRRLHQGMRPVSSKQDQHTHTQSPLVPNNDDSRDLPIPDRGHGLHHQITPI